MAEKLVLGYWGFRGLVQPIRYLLEYVQLPYENKNYNDPNEWFQVDKIKMQDDPYVNIPYLKDGDENVFEKEAIILYIIKKSGKLELLGLPGDQQLLLAQAQSIIKEFYTNFQKKILLLPKAEYEEKKEENWKAVQVIIKKLDKFIGQKGYKFTVGDQLTVIDFPILEALDLIRNYGYQAYNTFENLKILHKNLEEVPLLKEYRGTEAFKNQIFFPPQLNYN